MFQVVHNVFISSLAKLRNFFNIYVHFIYVHIVHIHINSACVLLYVVVSTRNAI